MWLGMEQLSVMHACVGAWNTCQVCMHMVGMAALKCAFMWLGPVRSHALQHPVHVFLLTAQLGMFQHLQ